MRHAAFERGRLSLARVRRDARKDGEVGMSIPASTAPVPSVEPSLITRIASIALPRP